MKKLIGIMLIIVMVFTFTACGCINDEAATENATEKATEEKKERALPDKDIVVLFTNDVHCGVEDTIGYAGVAALKKKYEEKGNDVILADVGDAIQGGPIGTISRGEYIIDIMNYVGYDVATIGNHEFDYGSDRLLELKEKAAFSYVAANFKSVETGKAVFEPYTIIEKNGVKIAFVGVVTPKTITSSAPVYFQNEKGEYVYSFDGGNDGKELYASVQKAVDDAKKEGADYVVALTHLGIEAACSPWMSTEVIYNTTGIDVVLDGHSHSNIECEKVKNKDGKDVLLAQTGTKLNAVGVMTISTAGAVTTELVTEIGEADEETDAFIKSIMDKFNAELQRVVAKSEVDLTILDPVTGVRIIRNAETNLGDLCADAYRILSGADIGFVNGGGIRTDILKGDVTFEEILNVHPFGNALCVVEATGQEIIDALEMGAMYYPEENGGFLHVSGLTYEIDSKIPSAVVLTGEGLFEKVDGAYRVSNVKVNGEDILVDKTYTLASHDYMIKKGGDGYSMFMDNTLLQDSIMLDNQVLINYITEYLKGSVGEEYSNPYGQGRIIVK